MSVNEKNSIKPSPVYEYKNEKEKCPICLDLPISPRTHGDGKHLLGCLDCIKKLTDYLCPVCRVALDTTTYLSWKERNIEVIHLAKLISFLLLSAIGMIYIIGGGNTLLDSDQLKNALNSLPAIALGLISSSLIGYVYYIMFQEGNEEVRRVLQYDFE